MQIHLDSMDLFLVNHMANINKVDFSSQFLNKNKQLSKF